MSATDFDRTEWAARDERARRAKGAQWSHVEGKLTELVRIFADHDIREAYVFGSTANATARLESDVDMAVAGCPPEVFYRLGAKLERVLGLPLDLIDLDRAPRDFATAVRSSGRRIFAAPEESRS